MSVKLGSWGVEIAGVVVSGLGRGVARRERVLAGGSRAGSFARAKARSAQYSYVRRNWQILALVGAGLLAVITAACLVTPGGFARGAVAGAGVTAVAGLLAFQVVQATGTASTMMGDLAEQWTARELRGLRGSGWKVVNHLQLRAWDIDHVLIGPGGVFAVETKWSAAPWDPAEQRMALHVDQVRRNARDLRLWLRVPQVTPVLVLWGADSRNRDHYTRDGVHVVMGPQASVWRRALPGSVLAPVEVQRIWGKLSEQAASRDPLDDASVPPPSVNALGVLAVSSVAAALLGLLASLWLVRLPGPPALALAAQSMLLAAGLLVGIEHRLLRYPLLAARVGIGFGFALTLGLTVL